MSVSAVHPAVNPACPDCNGHSYLVKQQGERAEASICPCVGRCPLCRDSGWIGVGDDWRAPKKRCVCGRIHGRIALYNDMGIPGRHATSTRDNFVWDKSKGLTRAFLQANNVVNMWNPENENRGIVFHGPVGTGKTHLMCAVLRDLVFEHGVRARFVEFSHLLADLKASFDQKSGSASVLSDLVRVDVLAIDELGKGRNTEWEGTVLDELVSRRYNAAATVLATSNYAPEATGRAASNLASPHNTAAGLPDRVGERVFSRLFELCEFVPMVGGDWRRKRATQNR